MSAPRFTHPFWKRAAWSVIAAAFIGPGTVTTAARAGAEGGWTLMGVVAVSIFACWLLQEAAARLSAGSGMDLGEIIGHMGKGASWQWLSKATFGAVFIGNTAYQAGNLIGAAVGLQLMTGIQLKAALLVAAGIAALLLLIGNLRSLSLVLTALVAVMGIGFLYLAIRNIPASLAWTTPLPAPDLSLLAVGLLGTTVVPYNLFLGSRLGKSQSLADIRWGLAGSVLIGGMITAAIMVASTGMKGAFSLAGVAAYLQSWLGTWAGRAFGLGFFAAGITSAITAPMAAAITFQSVTGGANKPRNYTAVWVLVLLGGLVGAWWGGTPTPVILLAQALNGLLLPLLAAILWRAVNRFEGLPVNYRNTPLSNIATLLVVILSLFLGLTWIGKAMAGAGISWLSYSLILRCLIAVVGALMITFWSWKPSFESKAFRL